MYAPSPPVKPFQNLSVMTFGRADSLLLEPSHPAKATAAPAWSAQARSRRRLNSDAKRDGCIFAALYRGARHMSGRDSGEEPRFHRGRADTASSMWPFIPRQVWSQER